MSLKTNFKDLKVNNFYLFLIFFNCYFIISYFSVFAFYNIEDFMDQYQKHFVKNLEFKALIYLILVLTLINFSAIILEKLFNKKKFLNLKNIYYYELFIIFIILYFGYNIYNENFLLLPINHISNVIFLIFISLILLNTNNTFYFLIVFSIFLLILFKFTTSSFFALFFISSLMIIISKKYNKLYYLPIFFLFSIIIILSVLYLNKNNKNGGVTLDYDATILRISHFHIINKIFERTPLCENHKINEIDISNRYNDIIDNNYSISENLKLDIFDLYLDLNKETLTDKEIMFLNKNKTKKIFNTIKYKLQNTCMSQEYLYGKYIIKFINEKTNLENEKNNLNFYGNKFGKKYGLLSVDDFKTGVGPTFFGDLYMNFGFFGIIFSSIFILTLLFILSIHKDIVLTSISFYIFSNFLLSLESTAIELLFNIGKLSFFYFFVLFYLLLRKNFILIKN